MSWYGAAPFEPKVLFKNKRISKESLDKILARGDVKIGNGGEPLIYLSDYIYWENPQEDPIIIEALGMVNKKIEDVLIRTVAAENEWTYIFALDHNEKGEQT